MPFRTTRALCLALLVVLGTSGTAAAQDWKISAYPILVWVPLGIDTKVEIPDGGGGSAEGSIVDGRFDGAFFGGVGASNGTWRVEANVMWAAVGGDRVERPSLTVDADVIYGRGVIGRAVAPNFFITGGVRRLALDYSIALGTLPTFERKPGVWDPIVGIGYHRIGEKLEVHGTFEGGGFGVGADVDLGGTFQIDWKPVKHFGLTAGYGLLYFKVTDEIATGRTFTVKQSLHGPIAGIGFYF